MALDAPGGAISHLDLEKRGQQVGGRPAIAIGGVGEVLPVAVDARQAQGLEQGRQYGGGLILGAGHQCTSPLAIRRSEEHTSELQSLMRISYAVFCLKKKTTHTTT